MKLEVLNQDITSIETDIIFLSLFENASMPSGNLEVIDKALNGLISEIIKNKELKGEIGEFTILNTNQLIEAKKICIIGLGKPEKFKFNDFWLIGSTMAEAIKKTKSQKVASLLHGIDILTNINPKRAFLAIIEGILLNLYQCNDLKSAKKDQKIDIKKFTLINPMIKESDVLPSLESLTITIDAVNRARDLVNLPSNIITPSYLAKRAEEIAKSFKKVKVKIFEKKDLEKLSAGAFLSVAKGATQEPKMIVLEYNNASKNSDIFGLIGKGVTFDSGGISLKPAKKMSEMKTDMSGAATVLEAISAIAQIGLKINLIAVIPATENMPDSEASKPGDVITAMNGKTVEIISTDAEGRMILADAISYAINCGANKIIDFATLTGGCVVALGELYAAIMGNDQLFIDEIIMAGKKTGEKIWQLPLDPDYKELIKSDIADMVNCGETGMASPIVGGIFLNEFAKNMTWAHIDIAGTAYLSSRAGFLNKGATGFGIRTLIEFLKNKE